MKQLLFLLPLLAIISCSDPDNPYDAQFNSRGCLECDNYTAGETFMIDGVRYEVADRAILETAIDDGDDLTRYCTSRIGGMEGLFYSKTDFNNDIGNWDVSNVTDMSLMFYQNYVFNQDIGHWDVSNVTDMSRMFQNANTFDQDIGNWDVSNVTDMTQMFDRAASFNQDLTQWCVSNFSNIPSGFVGWPCPLQSSNFPVWGTCP